MQGGERTQKQSEPTPLFSVWLYTDLRGEGGGVLGGGSLCGAKGDRCLHDLAADLLQSDGIGVPAACATLIL